MMEPTQLPSSVSSVLVSPEDALVLLEAVRLGLIPRTTRRLTRSEREALIGNGRVFVWEEEETGMQRWTDGKKWSCSRVCGEFLGYDQVSGEGPGRTRGSDGVPARRLPGGLIKQTFQTTLCLAGQSPKKFHVISYHVAAAAHLLHRPSQDPAFAKLSLSLWANAPSSSSTSPSSRLSAVKRSSSERELGRVGREKSDDDNSRPSSALHGVTHPSSSRTSSRSRGAAASAVDVSGAGSSGSSSRTGTADGQHPPWDTRSASSGGDDYSSSSSRLQPPSQAGSLARARSHRGAETWEPAAPPPRRVQSLNHHHQHPRAHLLNSPTPSLTSNSSASSSRSTSPRYAPHHPYPLYDDPRPRSASSSSSARHPPYAYPGSHPHSWPARPASQGLPSTFHDSEGSPTPLPSLVEMRTPTAGSGGAALPPLSALSLEAPDYHPHHYGGAPPPTAGTEDDRAMLNRFRVRI